MDDLSSTVKVYVSTVPGLEFISVSECEDVFQTKAKKEERGRVSFNTQVKHLNKLRDLRSVHHYWLEVFRSSSVFDHEYLKEDILKTLEDLVAQLDWESALYAFNNFRDGTGFLCKVGESKKNYRDSSSAEEELITGVVERNRKRNSECVEGGSNSKECYDVDKGNGQVSGHLQYPYCSKNQENGNDKDSLGTQIPKDIVEGNGRHLCKKQSDVKFRVTCSRSGKHNFTSMEVAKYIGSGVKGYFNWEVDLENFDVEVLAFINNLEITIALKLSDVSKHNRNVKYFGPTTLRATTSYCMLKLAGVKRGDIVCDPMCGTGSISLEGVSSFPFTFHLGGEMHPEGCQNAGKNFEHYQQGTDRRFALPHDILQWDACHLPLRDGLVDAVVCDLPFGKRIGYKGKNFALYPAVLREMARICRPNGKAIFLTQHKSAMNRTLTTFSLVWKKQATFFINMGGLNAAIYVLKREKKDLNEIQKITSHVKADNLK